MMEMRMGGSEGRRGGRGLDERIEDKRTEESEGMVRGKEAKREGRDIRGEG
jgi:hypothetical protein